MPYKRKPAPQKRKKTTRARKTIRKARVTNVVRSLGPIAPRTLCKMKYCDSFTTAGSGSLALTHRFNINSTFDPDLSGTGHQPYGRDTYATLYNRYRVYRCDYKIVCTMFTQTGACHVGTFASNNVSAMGQKTIFMETPGAKTAIINAQNRTVTLRGRVNLANLMGKTSTQYKTDDLTAALSTANPSENAILHFLVEDLGATTGHPLMGYSVELLYHVEWFDQLDLSQS